MTLPHEALNFQESYRRQDNNPLQQRHLSCRGDSCRYGTVHRLANTTTPLLPTSFHNLSYTASIRAAKQGIHPSRCVSSQQASQKVLCSLMEVHASKTERHQLRVSPLDLWDLLIRPMIRSGKSTRRYEVRDTTVTTSMCLVPVRYLRTS